MVPLLRQTAPPALDRGEADRAAEPAYLLENWFVRTTTAGACRSRGSYSFARFENRPVVAER
jgi:hypothetical protein